MTLARAVRSAVSAGHVQTKTPDRDPPQRGGVATYNRATVLRRGRSTDEREGLFQQNGNKKARSLALSGLHKLAMD
jgi:hypothetical protein